nr:hypothetical protein DM860_012942 [Ipomoea trifida]GME16154.1 DnaJ protein homolog 1-like [Ipomoea batatas]
MGDHHPKSPRTTNFHNILGISRTATLVDICKAYKCLVRKWHPDRNSLNRDEAQAKFTSINEAYRALSMKKREEAGGGSSDGEKSPKISDLEEEDQEFVISSPTLLSRTTSRIAPEVSRKMSQSASRRSRTTSTPTTPTGEPSLQSILTGKKISTPIIYSQSIARRKPQPVEQKLECTLEELCYGRVKVAKITREVISSSGLIVREEEYVTIVVQPGWKKGTRITFEGKGDERPGMLPADVIFTIEEKIHPVFKREGDDLELGVEIPLVQALTGCTITVPLLGDESMTLELDDIIYPGYEMTVPGQGMPKPKDFEGQRGDLLLKFLVEFPTDLSDEQRAEAARILQDCS